jgi:hypothetical protein
MRSETNVRPTSNVIATPPMPRRRANCEPYFRELYSCPGTFGLQSGYAIWLRQLAYERTAQQHKHANSRQIAPPTMIASGAPLLAP